MAESAFPLTLAHADSLWLSQYTSLERLKALPGVQKAFPSHAAGELAASVNRGSFFPLPALEFWHIALLCRVGHSRRLISGNDSGTTPLCEPVSSEGPGSGVEEEHGPSIVWSGRR